MKESGKVISADDRGGAVIEIRSSSGCDKCGACHFNGAGVLSMEAENKVGARAGDAVEIEIPEGSVIFSSLMIFIFPIVAFFSGYLIRGIITGAAFLSVYLVFLYYFDKRTRTAPKITRVLFSR